MKASCKYTKDTQTGNLCSQLLSCEGVSAIVTALKIGHLYVCCCTCIYRWTGCFMTLGGHVGGEDTSQSFLLCEVWYQLEELIHRK